MSDIPSVLSELNPGGDMFIGKKAANITRNILQNLDLSQHSANDIISALRDNNINITIPAFYSIYNEITGTKTRSQRIKYVNLQYVPNENILEPSLYTLQTKYRIVHHVEYTDIETGAELTRDFVLDTDVLSSIGDMQQMVKDAMESRYPIEVTGIKTIGGYISKSE